jgi:rubredoxin
MSLQEMTQPPAAASAGASDRWIRLPRRGYCPHCGLSRSHLHALTKDGAIRSVSLKKPGNVKGPRLIWLPSVFAWIEKQEAAQ